MLVIISNKILRLIIFQLKYENYFIFNHRIIYKQKSCLIIDKVDFKSFIFDALIAL
jgi:hypothetical protein